MSELDADGALQPRVDLRPLLSRIAELEAAGAELNASIASALRERPLDPVRAASLNRRIMDVESNWLDPAGLPGRPWFKHVLYAARYTYAHLELPGLTEAVEAEDWPRAVSQAHILEGAVVRNVALLREVRADLEASP